MYSVVGQGYDKRPERKKKPAISSGTVGTCSVISGSSGVGSGGAPISVVVVGGGGGGSGVAGLGVGKGGKSILTGGPVGLVVSDNVGVKSSGKNIKSSATSVVDGAEKGGDGKAKSNKGGGGENDKGANGEASDKSAKVGNGEDGASCGPSDAQQDGGVEDGTEKKKEHHHHHHHHHHVDNRPFLQRLFSLIRRLYGTEKEEEDEMDDFSLHVQRHRPEELDKLAKTTKFTRKEIQLIYRGFKQECPTGMVDEDGFKGIFSQFFPQGDATHYAHYVFNTFKQNNHGQISFEDFLGALSTVSRGTTQEKLQWIFGLYDVNNDGLITKTEMVDVVTAIYEMLGRSTEPQVDERSAKDHVEKIFHLIDTNQDGAITIEELAQWVSRDDTIVQSLSMMDTVLYTRRDLGAASNPPPSRPSLSQP